MAAKRKRAPAPAARPRRAPRPRRPPLGLLLVLLAVVVFVAHADAFRFTQDDAYISLRYARNLVEGHGLVFNPGERVEGYSNFTWTMLLALLLRLGVPAVPAATWLGVLFGAGAIVAAARLTRALEGRWGPGAVITAFLVAGTSAFALWSTGGLETALFAFLATAGLERGLAPGVSSRGRAVGAALLMLAAMTRPDGPILFAMWMAIRVADTFAVDGPARAAGGLRELVRDLLVFVVPLVPWLGWKLAYYGDVLPNTYYAKAGVSVTYVRRGLDYALDYGRAYGLWGLVPLVAVGGVVRAGLRSVEARLLLVWCGYAAYVVAIGGDVLHVHRFWMPILPVGAVLVARGAVALAARFAPAPRAPAVAVAIALVVVGVPLARQWSPIQERRQREISFVLNMRQTGEWLRAHLAPGSIVAITTIGAVGYYSRLPVLDMLGLTDREIARHPEIIEGLEDTWREVKYDAESVLRRRPTAIFFSTGVRPSSAAEKALFLHRGFYETYRPYYFRSVPERRSAQVMFRAREGDDAVDLRRVSVPGFGFIDDYGEAHLDLSIRGERARAIEGFRKTMETAGDEFPWAREWWAVARYDGGDTTAVADLREIVRETPDAVGPWIRIADAAMRAGRLEEARASFDRAVQLDPDEALAWVGRAEAARLSGDLEGAYRSAREAVMRWNTEPSHLVLLGNLAVHFGDWSVAEWAFDRTLRIAPDVAPAQRGLEIVRGVRSGRLEWPPKGSAESGP